jgi:hypothetical protein
MARRFFMVAKKGYKFVSNIGTNLNNTPDRGA